MATLDLKKIGTTTQVSNFLPTIPTITSTNTKAVAPISLTPKPDNTNYTGMIAGAVQQAQTYTTPSGAKVDAQGNVVSGGEQQPTQNQQGTFDIKSYIDQISGVQQPNAVQTYQQGYDQSGLAQQQADLNAKSAVTAEAQGRLNNISAQLQALNTEATAVPIQLQQDSEGRGRTAAGIEPLQADALRKIALRALPLQAQGAIIQAEVANAQGQQKLAQDLYTQAQDHFDKMFTLQMQDAERKYEFQTNLIDKVYEFADRNEQRQLAAIKDQKDRDFQTQQDTIAYQRDIAKIKLQDSLKSTGTTNNLEFISGTANQPAGTFNKATGVFTPLDSTAKGGGVQQLAGIKSQIDTIGGILNNPSLSNTVGTNFLSRAPQGFFGKAGAILTGVGIPSVIDSAVGSITGTKSNFLAGVQQITSQLTLNSLINAKAQGATFGALSEGELALLANSATKIDKWATKDSAGNVIGYNTSEANFKAELNNINNFAKLDYIIKGGDPADVGAKIMPDGTVWVANSDGKTYTQIK